MADRLRELPAKVLAWWNKFTARQRSIIIGITAVAIFTFAIIIYIVSKPQYVPLLTCSSTKDAAEVVEILENAGIKHKESSDGLKIEVESSQVSAANLAVGAAGYVPDDYTLEAALSGGLSTTASDTAKRYKLYMEKKLEGCFESMPMIKSADVNLDIPDQDGTLIAKEQEGGAYIQLELSGTFTSANAANMAKAVAVYLGNKTTANITIIDSEANLLFAGGDDYSSAGIASSMQELQTQAQNQVANEVKKVILGTKQFNNAVVTSNLTMDYATYDKTVKEYYANEDRDEGMYAHTATYESENTNDSGGTPGTDSNNENTMVYQNLDNSSSSSSESEIDYLPNESVERKNTPAGAIDLSSSSISVALIRYRELREEDAKSRGLLEGITWEEYKANNSEDIKLEVDPDYYSLVASATGISTDRITIVAYESPIFYDKEGMAVSGGTILSVVLFVLILALLAFVVLRSMGFRKGAAKEEDLSVEDLLQSMPEQEYEDIDVEAKSETRKLIEKFVDDNPEAAAALLRNWLNEDWG